MSHISNGDMVTMTLLQGVMNTFVVFLSRVIWLCGRSLLLRNGSDAPGIGYYLTTIVHFALSFLAAIVVAWFSRRREFRADTDAVTLMAAKQPMINALARLGGLQPGQLPQQVKQWASPDRAA
jgi:heat shock protein HtpX